VRRRRDIVLARFPFTDQQQTKLRPVLVLAEVPGAYRDFLVMFASSQLTQALPGDIVLAPADAAFAASGLKVATVFKIGKISTISVDLLVGQLGVLEKRTFDALVAALVHLLVSPG